MCSKLSAITTEPDEFCLDFGYPVNNNLQDFDIEEMQEDYTEGREIEPVCFDGNPSHERFHLKDPEYVKK